MVDGGCPRSSGEAGHGGGGSSFLGAREAGLCPFIVAAREGEAGRTLAGGGPPGAARAGARSDRRGRRRGEQRTQRGACRGRELPGKAGFKQTRGAGLVLGGGVTRGRPGGGAGVRLRP
jgi:hypothetical protein